MKQIAIGFRQIDYLIAIAEEGSTAAAARVLNVSQPSVSIALAQVEAHFGQPLFVRRLGQGMEPTAFGRSKIAGFRVLRKMATETIEDTERRVILGVFETLGPRFAPALIREYAAREPEVEIQLREGNLGRLFEDLATGRIDLALIYSFPVARELEIVPLREVRPFGLVPAGHRLAGSGTASVADLLRDPLILMNLPHSRDYFLSLAQMHGVIPRIRHETASVEMARAMVANGLGVSLLATDIAHTMSHDGRQVSRVQLDGPMPPHGIAIARSPDFPLTEPCSKFLDFAKLWFSGEAC
ncbi:LysR family transcriptional regulator [Cribrihabitans sp. XS_ASV171]